MTALEVLARSIRRSRRRAGVALLYHRIGDPQGDPSRELVPALACAGFEQHMRHLATSYDVVPASQLLTAVRARRRGERFPVAVTFDDDLGSHVREAMPILSRLGLPATFFLCGASLTEPFDFWWERLQAAIDSDEVSLATGAPALAGRVEAVRAGRDSIHALARTIETLPAGERARVASSLRAAGTDSRDRGMPEADVRLLAAAGFEIGFHTLRHDSLPALDDEALDEAMSEGRGSLASTADQSLTTIAYPHGSTDARVADAARRAGYRFGFTCRAVPVAPTSEPLLMGRLEPGLRSTPRFAARLAWTLLLGGRR